MSRSNYFFLTISPIFRGLVQESLLMKEFANYSNYEFVSQIKLLNKTFKEVYKVIEPKDNLLTELYFNKEYGIVGFKDLALKLWVFDRIE